MRRVDFRMRLDTAQEVTRGFGFFARFLPGAFGLPLRGDSAFASWTNLSSRAFGTARTPRMTSLKCKNSGVESKAGSEGFGVVAIQSNCTTKAQGNLF
jgi:hypothetical protein